MSDVGSCTHGVTFDEAEANKLLAVDATSEIRKRWPRGWFTKEKPCPGCGFVGIAYASAAHYYAGDW